MNSVKLILNKKILDKDNNILNKEFKELLSEQKEKIFDLNLATVDDFFILYNKLFYDIPKTGEQSHESLINQSNNYVNFDLINETIVALSNEINELREENLRLIQK